MVFLVQNNKVVINYNTKRLHHAVNPPGGVPLNSMPHLVSQVPTVYNHDIPTSTNEVRASDINCTAFDTKTLGVLFATNGGAADIVEAGVWRAHDVAVVIRKSGLAWRAGHWTRDNIVVHVNV